MLLSPSIIFFSNDFDYALCVFQNTPTKGSSYNSYQKIRWQTKTDKKINVTGYKGGKNHTILSHVALGLHPDWPKKQPLVCDWLRRLHEFNLLVG